jgi:hypothetical protein
MAALIAAFALSMSLTAVSAQNRDVWIFTDVSSSFAPITDPAANERVAIQLEELLAGMNLAFGDQVHWRLIGVVDPVGAIPFEFDTQLRFNGTNPQRVPSDAADLVRGLLGTSAQGMTEILFALEEASIRANCINPTDFIVISDGLESSDRVAQANRQLSRPDGTAMQGCNLHFLGFGLSPQMANNGALFQATRREWQAWAQDVGVSHVSFY